MAANDPLAPVRKLTPQEVADLTALAIPAHLAMLDPTGFPRVIPLWFLWEEGQTEAGYRPFRQIMVQGYAQVQPDPDGRWACKLIGKYITGQAAEVRAQLEAGKPHVVIALRPEHFLTTGFFPAH